MSPISAWISFGLLLVAHNGHKNNIHEEINEAVEYCGLMTTSVLLIAALIIASVLWPVSLMNYKESNSEN